MKALKMSDRVLADRLNTIANWMYIIAAVQRDERNVASIGTTPKSEIRALQHRAGLVREASERLRKAAK